jgi:hypothetical protein
VANRQTFAAGTAVTNTVLTAVAGQLIPSYANTTDRGTDNPSPTTGQLVWVTGTGYTYWSGAAWTTLVGVTINTLDGSYYQSR